MDIWNQVPTWSYYIVAAVFSYIAIRLISKLFTAKTKSILDDFTIQIMAIRVAIGLVIFSFYHVAVLVGLNNRLIMNLMWLFQLGKSYARKLVTGL